MPIASIAPAAGNDDSSHRNQWMGSAMEQLGYEPFGERLVPERDARLRSSVSKYLLWTGTSLFWSLVGAIVLARAAYFQPGILDGFDRVVALVGGALGVS